MALVSMQSDSKQNVQAEQSGSGLVPQPGLVEVFERGKSVKVPCLNLQGRTIVVKGRWLKIGSVRDVELVEGAVVNEPESFIRLLKSADLKMDLFTFPQNYPDVTPRYNYHIENDNVAVVSTLDYNDWWENKIPQEARKNVRRALKRGVSVQVVPFDDGLVNGIKNIYDETPIRQGRRFWHYQKTLDQVKMENGTYPGRSEFIGAFFDGELIGFIKLIYVDRRAEIIQILSKNSHYDKRPTNALLAKAVEVCQQRGIEHLVYGKFSYGRKSNSQLAEFKRRNGFEEKTFPKYYVPLTVKGRLGLALRMHRSLNELAPPQLINFVLETRKRVLWTVSKVSSRSNSNRSENSNSNSQPPTNGVAEAEKD